MQIVWIEREDHDEAYEVVRDRQLPIGSIYLVEDGVDAGELWGDDWNDAPECCNANPPYKAIRVDFSYGDRLEDLLEKAVRRSSA